MFQSVFIFFLAASIPWVACQSKSYRANIDILTDNYLRAEKTLWLRLTNDKEIRVNLLPEIYETHRNALTKDFGECGTVWELGIRMHENIITNILGINGTANNLQHALQNQQYDGAIAIAESAINKTVEAAKVLYQTTSQATFWSHISVNISHAECTKLTSSIPTESQLIFDVHSEIAAALLKSYISVQYSYMVLTVDEKENFASKAAQYREVFKQHYTAMQHNARTLLKSADQRKWTCDKSNQLSTTYHQITRFIQGYVDNEVNLNADDSCKATCDDYKQTRNYKCDSDTLCADPIVEHASTKCNGTVLNCEFIDDDVTVCPSVQKLDLRRYDYIQYTSGKELGKVEPCLQPISAESWTSWFVKCSNCFCYCDEESDLSDRYFSLRDVITDLGTNRVVTGVSIIKRNRIIQLMVSESVLLPYGKINTTSTFDEDGKLIPHYHLVAHDDFKITDRNVQNGVDYHKLTWEKRALNLDTVTAPANKVVTGVRFQLTADHHLALEIRATDFNYETGQLENVHDSVWISNPKKEKAKLTFDRPDIPTLSPQLSKPDWRPDQYVEFGPTDRVKDAGQITVPFIDALMVDGKPCPLSGAGLYLKARPGYAGFVAPVLIALNNEPYITDIDV